MNSSALLLSLAILSTSFWGSWHCVAMCSPIASLMAQRKTLWSYHFGRAISYVSLGAAGGYTGSFLLKNELHWIRICSGTLFTTILIFLGIQILKGKKVGTFRAPWLHAFFTRQTPGVTLGLLSAFLPCGWLYSYVLSAIATQSAAAGALVMFLFWGGGLPALSSISVLLRQSMRWSPQRKQSAAGMVLICAGLYSLMSFYFL